MASPTPWHRVTDRVLLQTRILEVRGTVFAHPQRRVEGKEFVVIDAPDWAVVAAVTPRGELVLVEQYRFGVEQLSLELPGGIVDPGEDPALGAARELAEETGYAGAAPVVLGIVHPNPAIQSNRAHLILIADVELTAELAWDPDEELHTTLMPIPEVLQRARAGEIKHALMLNALFWLEPWWRAEAPRRGWAGI